MEKIYENKNHNKNEKKQIKIDGTTILSFAVALFAIVSLVTVGFNQISYAIPDVELPIKDDFKVNGYADGANSGDRIIGTGAITNGDGTVTNTVFPVHPYFALEGENKFPVYCLEYDIPFTDDGEYSKEPNVVLDGGLLYLLANLYPNGKFYDKDDNLIDINKDENKALLTWITQSAIWTYMAEENIGANKTLTADMIKKIRATSKINKPVEANGQESYQELYSVNTTLFDEIHVYPESKALSINELIKFAKGLPAVATDLTINNGEQIKITNVSNDNKYYFSEVIKVREYISHSTIGEFNGFSIEIADAPEGTVITDKNGKALTNEEMADVKAGTELYVRVPVNKINEKNKVATFKVVGSFDTFIGYGYRAIKDGKGQAIADPSKSQRITLVDKVNNNHVRQFKINLDYVPDVPDTGMNTAQSIYFIGLVVLLCGIGIVYANTKPATNKQ